MGTFPRYWPSVSSPHKGEWHGALVFCLICAWINGWAHNRDAGDLRRHSAHYDVTAMILIHSTDILIIQVPVKQFWKRCVTNSRQSVTNYHTSKQCKTQWIQPKYHITQRMQPKQAITQRNCMHVFERTFYAIHSLYADANGWSKCDTVYSRLTIHHQAEHVFSL